MQSLLNSHDVFKTKTILVTGASSGIGYETSLLFGLFGCKNLILVSRRLNLLQDLKQKIHSSNMFTNVMIRDFDVRDYNKVNEFVDSLSNDPQLKDFNNKIDILINNAGLALGLTPVQDVELEHMDTMIDTNIKGAVYFLKKVIPLMKKNDYGHIVNVASIAGLQAYANGSIYSATKHALIAISNSLRLELVDTKIRVSTMNPGLVETEFSIVRFNNDKEKAKNIYKGLKPLTGRDIAECIIFMCSRPDHVVIADMTVFPVGQGNIYTISRNH